MSVTVLLTLRNHIGKDLIDLSVQEEWFTGYIGMLFFCCNIRAFSSSLLRAIIARNLLPFFKLFSNFVHFCPNSEILALFCSF